MVNDSEGAAGNPWGVQVRHGLFHLTNDISSGLLIDSAGAEVDSIAMRPVYEGKHIWIYDHRLATYLLQQSDSVQLDVQEKSNSDLEPRCR
jgi:hypothetical protein